MHNEKRAGAAKKLAEWVEYNPLTGKLYWKKTAERGTRVAGREAGTAVCGGYKVLKFQGVTFKVHQVAFWLMEGRCPPIIDHINHVKDDNSWKNLREVTSKENALNRSPEFRSKTGVQGIYFTSSKRNRYIAKLAGRTSKSFKNIDAAVAALKEFYDEE